MKKFFVFVFSFFLFSLLNAQIKIISPVEGIWGNKQMLVLDTSDGSDYFYSLNGENPEVAGFAYDGPVLIDLTGDITVTISKGFEEKTEIKYTVNPTFPENELERGFIYSFFDSGLLNYFSGTDLIIPETLRYSFESKAENFNPGKKLSYSENCSLLRFIPCTVTNGNISWRFIIRTNPGVKGTFSRRDLPFTVQNWDTISFEDENLIYKIDNEYWGLPKDSVKLDRSVRHMIYWQDIAYDVGNPVEFFELPPIPELHTLQNTDGSVSLVLAGDESYSMTFYSPNEGFYELFTELSADTFQGDYLKEKTQIAVYADSVYQGLLPISFEIDKRLPSFPVFTPSVSGFHVREDVKLNIKTASNCQLYIAVSEPVILDDSKYSVDDLVFQSVLNTSDDFTLVNNNTTLVLSSVSEKPVYYKVKAFSVSGAHKSDVSEYAVIIDNQSFYFDSQADASLANGSAEHPFTDFEQCRPALSQVRSAVFYVKGAFRLPEEKLEVKINCDINGMENAEIIIPEETSLTLKSSTLQIKNCRVVSEKKNSTAKKNGLIKLDHSVLYVSDSEVFFNGGKNSTLIDSVKSVVTIKNTACAVTSQAYASFISATDSKLDFKNISLSLISDTIVAVSVRGSQCNLSDSVVRLTGNLGRACEFFSTEGFIRDNLFAADLKRGGSSIKPVFIDGESKIKEDSNISQGF